MFMGISLGFWTCKNHCSNLALSNFAVSNLAASLEPPVLVFGQDVNINASASNKNHRFFIGHRLSKTRTKFILELHEPRGTRTSRHDSVTANENVANVGFALRIDRDKPQPDFHVGRFGSGVPKVGWSNADFGALRVAAVNDSVIPNGAGLGVFAISSGNPN
jgi:hypothetical protein